MRALQSYKLTILSLIGGVTGALLFFYGQVWVGLTLVVVSYFLAAQGFMKSTHTIQIIMCGLTGGFLGVGLDIQTEAVFPYFTIALISGGLAGAIRNLFITKMGFVNYVWGDFGVFLVGMACYVGGNLVTTIGLMGWILPVPILLFNGITVIAAVIEGRAYFKHPQTSSQLNEGDEAPDVRLKDHTGTPVQLSDFLAEKNVLFFFIRIDWCPACRMMLRSYEKHQEALKAYDVRLLAVSPVSVEQNNKMAEDLGLAYKVLSDPEFKAAKSFKVYAQDSLPIDKESENLPPTIPSSFLIDKEGVIRYVARPDKAGAYIDPDGVLSVLKSLKQKH